MTTKLMTRIYVLIMLYSICIHDIGYLVAASGVFEIRLEEFVNDGGREQRGNCCEGVTTGRTGDCSEPCRTSFRICFSHYRNNLGSDKACTFGSAQTPVLGENTIISGESGDAGSNLVRLDFNFTWPRAFSLVIEATHQRGGKFPEKVIARMEKIASIDANTEWKTETQTQQEKILRYSYRVRCDRYYYGDACSKYCRPRDDMFGHWKCDRSGEKVCLPGWTSVQANAKSYCLQPVCRPGCNTTHGYCKRPNECICRQGWKGALCNQCRTHPQCSRGTCHDSFECNCDPGWGGMLCNQDLNYCTNHKPCKNGARCTNVGQGSFSCECAAGFAGRECELKMNECDASPCLNGAKCEVREYGYRCECPENFFGSNCGSTHMTCATISCRNGGTCLEDGARCRCQPGFRGANCEVKEALCPSAACLNGGTCRRSRRSFLCYCLPGFHGSRCQNKAGKCRIGTCKNGGKCSRVQGGYKCECTNGFSGPRCELSMDPCRSNPCQNDGLCKRNDIGYECICSGRFTGRFCEHRSNCFVSPCKNGGRCLERGSSHVCVCADGYRGQDCERLPEATGSLHASHNNKHTKIIVLTKDHKSGLSTAQWITVCFASAFLLLVFIAIAFCTVYQRYNKMRYTRGRSTKRLRLPRGSESRNGEDTTERLSSSPVHRATRPEGTETSPLPCRDYCASKTAQIHPISTGVESPVGATLVYGHAYSSQSDVSCSKAHFSSPEASSHAIHSSLSLGRLKNEEVYTLPTYQEACGERQELRSARGNFACKSLDS